MGGESGGAGGRRTGGRFTRGVSAGVGGRAKKSSSLSASISTGEYRVLLRGGSLVSGSSSISSFSAAGGAEAEGRDDAGVFGLWERRKFRADNCDGVDGCVCDGRGYLNRNGEAIDTAVTRSLDSGGQCRSDHSQITKNSGSPRQPFAAIEGSPLDSPQTCIQSWINRMSWRIAGLLLRTTLVCI
jgi:hypothetical protein